MKCSLEFSWGKTSNFLEEISSLWKKTFNFIEEISSLHCSVVFLYLFALSTEEGFLNLSLLLFGTLHSDAYIFPFLLCFSLLFFSQLFVRPPQRMLYKKKKSHFAFFNLFSMCMVLIPVSCTMS